MEYTTLGKTGLRVSVMGLGGGGHSRLGQSTGGSSDSSVAVVRRAAELGINFIDTAEAYRTEPVIGAAIKGSARSNLILSTKKSMTDQDRLISPDDVVRGLENSLKRLGTDYVDIYHLHAVYSPQYEYARDELLPVLQKLRDQGKLRFIGVTEQFGNDPQHKMMSRAVEDDIWDVVMVGFNILNQSARQRIFPATQRNNTGVLCMFAVRDALSRPAKLREIVGHLVERGEIDADAIDPNDPLGFVTGTDGVGSLTEAAYRFCRAEPGIDVVLSGTGSVAHLEDNVAAILKPPLPAALQQRLEKLFGHVDSVSGQ